MNPAKQYSNTSAESSGSLKSVATGLFIDWEKRKILMKGVENALRARYNTLVECGPLLPGNVCQLTLRAPDPPLATPSHAPPQCSHPVNFGGSKQLLDLYLTMIKESRPNFVFEKRPETIDLDSSDDDSCIIAEDESCIIMDDSFSNDNKSKVPTRRSKNGQSKNLVKDGKGDVVLSDNKCRANESSESIKNPDTTATVIRRNSLCAEKLVPAIVDISDDVIIVESFNDKQSENNGGDRGTTNHVHKNVNVTFVGEERTVALSQSLDALDRNSRRKHKRDRSLSGVTKCEGRSVTLSPSLHVANDPDAVDQNSQPKYKRNKILTTVKSILLTDDEGCITYDDLEGGTWKETRTQTPAGRAVPEKENVLYVFDNQPSCSSKLERKGSGLLFYKRLPHLSQSGVKDVAAPSASQSNIFNPVGPVLKKTGLRPIIIDANNVGVGHGGKGMFSLKGLQMCVDYFAKRGHREIKAFLPQYRKTRKTYETLTDLEERGIVVFTPSRYVNDKMVASYDDRYIVQYAHEVGGVIISNDLYRDVVEENPSWKETVEKRLLMFTWVNDMLIFPQDPLGKNGPKLDQYLRFPD